MQAFAEIEEAGMYVRQDYLEDALDTAAKKIKELSAELKSSEYWRQWLKRFGLKAKLTSEDQLSWLFYEHLKKPVRKKTDKGKPSTDATEVAGFRDPFADNWVLLNKWIKIKNTYLRNIKKESRSGLLHPFFNLHITDTFRSSSDRPNFQNMPIRDPMMGEIIRSTLGFRPGHVGFEIDYSGVEVTGAACYHKDPTMISYLLDPSKDMHRDMAGQCYKLKKGDVGKLHRYCGKNKFVFPQFYGDWYLSCAKALWESIEQMDLKGPEGEDLKEYLYTQGIEELGACRIGESPVQGTFEKHIQMVEKDFWERRFKVYGQWRKDWFAKYQERGYFDTLTGFRLEGVMSRNQVINYPVQGSCFHCLLWATVQLTKELRRRKMKSKIVGQIHDSIVADVPIEEAALFIKLARHVMTKRIHKWAPWLIVPLQIEVEMIGEGMSWFDKTEVEFNGKTWSTYNKKEDKTYKFTTAANISNYLNKTKSNKAA